MKALIIIGCIVLLLLLIGLIRVGAVVAYSEAGLFLTIKAGPVCIRVLPARTEKKEKKKQLKKQSVKEKEEATPQSKTKDTLALAMRFMPLLGEAAGRLKRKIYIDRLFLHVIWGAENPASAAMGYGAGNAAMGILWPLLENNFKVKNHDLHVDVDFERTKPAFRADAQATLTIGQVLTLGVVLGVKALKIYLGFRREQTEQKAVQ